MMHFQRPFAIGAVLAAGLLLAGCGGGDRPSLQAVEQVTGIDLHEPGQYMGKTDPLLQKSGTEQLANQLADRLQQVQTDR
ncbi:MAG: hypothetical protein R3202_00950 [Candidatus Competibacterales bacterium]|nr:hypothetical protein [Candidatus Competibacterales bacterium]